MCHPCHSSCPKESDDVTSKTPGLDWFFIMVNFYQIMHSLAKQGDKWTCQHFPSDTVRTLPPSCPKLFYSIGITIEWPWNEFPTWHGPDFIIYTVIEHLVYLLVRLENPDYLGLKTQTLPDHSLKNASWVSQMDSKCFCIGSLIGCKGLWVKPESMRGISSNKHHRFSRHSTRRAWVPRNPRGGVQNYYLVLRGGGLVIMLRSQAIWCF